MTLQLLSGIYRIVDYVGDTNDIGYHMMSQGSQLHWQYIKDGSIIAEGTHTADPYYPNQNS